MKISKTIPVKVLQGNYGHGWEDICLYQFKDAFTMKKEAMTDLRAYRENAPEYSYRIISRRIQNPNYKSKEEY